MTVEAVVIAAALLTIVWAVNAFITIIICSEVVKQMIRDKRDNAMDVCPTHYHPGKLSTWFGFKHWFYQIQD